MPHTTMWIIQADDEVMEMRVSPYMNLISMMHHMHGYDVARAEGASTIWCKSAV